MKRSINNKSGISPVIATALLVLLMIVLFGIIFWWSMGLFNEQVEKFGKPMSDSCESVNIEIENVMGGVHLLEVVNKGNIDVYDLEIRLFKGGEEKSLDFGIPIAAGESASKEVTLTMTFEVGGPEPDKIIVYPVLLGEGKDSNIPFTCKNEGQTIKG